MSTITSNSIEDRIKAKLRGDRTIWIVVAVLSAVSLLAVYSSVRPLAYRTTGGNTEYLLLSHFAKIVLGLFIMYMASTVHYKKYANWAYIGMIISAILLILTPIIGVTTGGATRRVEIPYLEQTLQPSELARISVMTYLAAFLSKYQNSRQELDRRIYLPLIILGFFGILIFRSNNSTALILLFSAAALMVIGRVPFKWIAALGAIGVAAFTVLYKLKLGERGNTFFSRIELWINDMDADQVIQAKKSIVDGGIVGVGPGNSIVKDIQSEPQSDYIFSIITEEYGIIGAVVIMICYLTLLWRGTIAVSKSKNAFAGLLSAGLTLNVVIQAFIHMCVNVELMPVTGQPLPFVSWGGNAILSTGFALGIILSVSRGDEWSQIEREKLNNEL